jgi:flagellar biosynthetic protein FlhB
LIRWNLQQFADDKTEKATPRKRQEIRRKGQIFKSQDLQQALGLLLALIVLKFLGSFLLNNMETWTKQGLNLEPNTELTAHRLQDLFFLWFLRFAVSSFPILGILFVGNLILGFVQSRGLFRPQAILPDFKRLNPLQGFKRFVTLRSGEELLKACLKVAIVAIITYLSLQNEFSYMQEWARISPLSMIAVIGNAAFQIGLKIAIVLLILGVLDYWYQRYEFEKSIRMTKQEVKEEFKQTEGNPLIKRKIRERQRAIAMRRMMAEVPKADVVITNPTHYAVALKYTPEMNAPKVVAKGMDSLALKIREVARNADVPIVENRPLARSLYYQVEMDEEIPSEMFQAVAEVLAYVYRLKMKYG